MSDDCVEKDTETWIKVLNYFSKFIVPATLVTVSLGVIYAYAAIQENGLSISHLQKDLNRVSTEHNGRIQSNRIATRENSTKISSIEAILPQILEYVKDLKDENKEDRKFQKEVVNGLTKLEKTVIILMDRQERKLNDIPQQ